LTIIITTTVLMYAAKPWSPIVSHVNIPVS
jgi:hypothetical protein